MYVREPLIYLFIYLIEVLRRVQEYFTYTTAVSIMEQSGQGQIKPTTFRRLLGDLPTYGREGSQHEHELSLVGPEII